MTETQAQVPLCAVFFNDVSACSAHHIDRWIRAGHRVCACVVSHRPQNSRWRRDKWRRIFAPNFALSRVLHRHGVLLVTAPKDLNDPDFIAWLAKIEADVLISVAFPYRISEQVLAPFKCGGINVHPALLPQYRGPQPAEVMAIDQTLERFGGVTVHRISNGFDEGDIISQSAILADDLLHPEWHSMWFARIGAELVVEKVPKFCTGQLNATRQPRGNYRYARLRPEDLVITPRMSVATLALRARVLGPLGSLIISLGGRTFKIGGLSRFGPKTDGPPRVSWNVVEFDALDGRIWLRRENRFERRRRNFRILRQLRIASLDIT